MQLVVNAETELSTAAVANNAGTTLIPGVEGGVSKEGDDDVPQPCQICSGRPCPDDLRRSKVLFRVLGSRLLLHQQVRVRRYTNVPV